MKKILCAFLTLALFCAVGAGCRPNIIDKPDDEYEVNLNVDKNISETLTILVPSNDGGLEESYIEALKPGFKEMFPNVEIKLDRRTISDAKYAESISSAIASSNVPDLFYTNTVFYYYLVSKNCVVSLEPYYEATKKAGTLDLEADYYNSFFNMSTYENKRYVVPRSMDSVVTYYNTEILQAAGIDPETDERFSNDWTWEDLVSVCYDLNAYFSSEEGKAAGYGNAFALHADFDWEAVFNAMMLSYGAEVFDGEGKVAVESENMKTMAKMIRELAEAGRILRTSTSGSTFGNGNCAFHFSSLGPARMDLNAAIKGKFDALPFPLIGKDPKIGCGFAGWGISSTTPVGAERDLAWQFLQYMISKEGQSALINAGLATPSVRIDLAEEKAWSKGYQDLNLDAWLVGEEYKVSSKFFVSQAPSCTFDILTAMQEFMMKLVDTDKSVDSLVIACKEQLEEAVSFA